jgi:hypothetical protein
MSTWRPPWSAPGQFKLTLLPATRASNSVMARRPPGPGSTAALRAGSRGPLHSATCPPIWAGPAADHASAPVGPSPSGHAQPAQPQPPHSAPHEKGPGQASTDPMRPQRADRWVWRGREAFALLGWGEQCEHGCADAQWQTPCRRCRTDGARLRRNPNLRPGRLHRPALPVQPRSVLRAAPRMGPAEGDSAAHPPARPRSWVMLRLDAGYRGPAGRGWIAGKKACATSRVEAPQPQQGEAV